jgi:hypothetical protein
VPSPFPGMDPYLEHSTLWPGVHNGLIAALQLSLAPSCDRATTSLLKSGSISLSQIRESLSGVQTSPSSASPRLRPR